jgi:glycosyltransferase involved in cell wall biosynthesis
MDTPKLDCCKKENTPTIVFSSQYFMPEEGATSELLSGIAMALVRRKFIVGAIAGQPTYFRRAKIAPNFLYKGVTVKRVWSTQFGNQRQLGRILDQITFSVSVLVHLFKKPKQPLTVTVTTPPQLPWTYLAANRLTGLEYIVLIHDVYPDVATTLGVLPKGGWIERLWSKINKLTYDSAKRIVVLGHDMKRIIENVVGEETRRRITIIPNWADACSIIPLDRDTHPLLKHYNIADRFIVQYSGNIGRFHEIETILAAAKILEKDPAFLFLFIGSGQQEDLLQRAADCLECTNILMLPHQPRENLCLTLTGCDVGLVTLKEGLAGLSVPSKLYGILAAGKPVIVIGPKNCESARVVRERQCGEVVSPGDGMELAERLRALRNDPNLRGRYGKAARAALEQDYELEKVADTWETMLRSVLAEN